jgi:hypothetical protein
VQIDPIKPTFKAPGTNILVLKYDKPLSTFAFKYNLRRYTVKLRNLLDAYGEYPRKYRLLAGAYTCPLLSST